MFRRSLCVVVFAAMALAVSAARDAAPAADSTDVAWLGTVVKPVFDYDPMTHRWSADSSSVIFENLIVDWRDDADTATEELRSHRFQRTLSCLPTGTLVLSNGDSVAVRPAAARIEQLIRSGPIGIYRMVLPVVDAAGKPLTEAPSGQVTITLSASKIIDRKYSVEMTRQTMVELP